MVRMQGGAYRRFTQPPVCLGEHLRQKTRSRGETATGADNSKPRSPSNTAPYPSTFDAASKHRRKC